MTRPRPECFLLSRCRLTSRKAGTPRARTELTAAGSGVGGQSQQQPDLLSSVRPAVLTAERRGARQLLYVAGGCLEQLPYDGHRDVSARRGLARATHALQRLAGQQPLFESPAERGFERASPQRAGRRRHTGEFQALIAARSTGGLTLPGARRASGSALSRRAACR